MNDRTDTLVERLDAWIDERLDALRADRSKARKDGDERGQAGCTYAMLELYELRGWLLQQKPAAPLEVNEDG